MRKDDQQKPSNKPKQQTHSPQDQERNRTPQSTTAQDKGSQGKVSPSRSDDAGKGQHH